MLLRPLTFLTTLFALQALATAEPTPLLGQTESWQVEATETFQGQASEPRVTVWSNDATLRATAQSGQVTAKAKLGSAHKLAQLSVRPQQNSVSTNYWIYDASITLLGDPDADRYYSRFSLEFDADTVFSQSEVYARFYLGNGEVFKEFHTSRNFVIQQDATLDALIIESELLTGFVPNDYEILIELYEVQSNRLVAFSDGRQDPDLFLVPLESTEFEEVYVEPVVVIEPSGGSILWLSGLALLLLVVKGGIRGDSNE